MSVLIVLSLIPLFTLFAFVINVGMLVNAKISLQNAADLAAYAGAATQARQLTHISHLNYQMRQAYKKFLFRYYVLGNMSLRCYPRGNAQHCVQAGGVEPSGATYFDWKNPGSNYPGVPSVCVAVSTENNVCQLTQQGVPVVKPPPCFPTDPICGQLQTTAQQIAEIQRRSCKANTVVNQELLTFWLYSTSKDTRLQTQTNLNLLVQDVGLVPENISHFQRIKTIQNQYVNAPPQTGLTARRIADLSGRPDQVAHERSILAFETARGNLNEKVFDHDTLEMTELLPANNEQLVLEPIHAEFDAMYSVIDNSQIPPGGGGTGDRACPMLVEKLRAKPYVGVYKDPSSRVYYAVKLTAKAKIFFNPFPFGNPAPEIELTAYAAAQPFGSRIGPKLESSHFVRSRQVGSQQITYPTLPLSDGEGGPAYTMESADVLRGLYQVLRAAVANGDALSLDAINRGIQTALLPDQFEIGKYNIPADVESLQAFGANSPGNPMITYFKKSQGGFGSEYTFWAPLQSANAGGDLNEIRDLIKQEIQDNISLSTTASTDASRLSGILQNEIDRYLNTLRARNNFNVARMTDPFGQYLFGANPPNLVGKVSRPKDSPSSFTSDRDYHLFSVGRDGYSVKFIPLSALHSDSGPGGNLEGTVNFQAIRDSLFGTLSDLNSASH